MKNIAFITIVSHSLSISLSLIAKWNALTQTLVFHFHLNVAAILRTHQHRSSFEVWISSRRLINLIFDGQTFLVGWLVCAIVIIRYCESTHGFCFRTIVRLNEWVSDWVRVSGCIKLYAMSSSLWMTHGSTFIEDDLLEQDGRVAISLEFRFISYFIFAQMLMDFNWHSCTPKKAEKVTTLVDVSIIGSM